RTVVERMRRRAGALATLPEAAGTARFFFMSAIFYYSSAALRTFFFSSRHGFPDTLALACIAGSDSMYIIVVIMYICDILSCVEEQSWLPPIVAYTSTSSWTRGRSSVLRGFCARRPRPRPSNVRWISRLTSMKAIGWLSKRTNVFSRAAARSKMSTANWTVKCGPPCSILPFTSQEYIVAQRRLSPDTLLWLSSVVLEELYAGAWGQMRDSVERLEHDFERAKRILV